MIVGCVNNFYLDRADKSTIFGMQGLWGLTLTSRRVATFKWTGVKGEKNKWPPFSAEN